MQLNPWQRFLKNDPYNQIIQHFHDGEAALRAMARRMMDVAVRPMFTQFVKSEADHRALNVRFEDFGAAFDDTVLRILRFLGVPEGELDKWVAEARRFDLARNVPHDHEHVTQGKHDRQPLIDFVLANPGAHSEFVSMRRILRYG